MFSTYAVAILFQASETSALKIHLPLFIPQKSSFSDETSATELKLVSGNIQDTALGIRLNLPNLFWIVQQAENTASFYKQSFMLFPAN